MRALTTIELEVTVETLQREAGLRAPTLLPPERDAVAIQLVADGRARWEVVECWCLGRPHMGHRRLFITDAGRDAVRLTRIAAGMGGQP